jgi:hypothetical protein
MKTEKNDFPPIKDGMQTGLMTMVGNENPKMTHPCF